MQFVLFAAVASAAVLTRDTACAPATFGTPNGRVCTVQCGVDHPGGDYANQHVDNFQSCVQACAADVRCTTAQYQTTNGYCYFKAQTNPASSNPTVNGVVCQYPGPSGPPTTTPGPPTTTPGPPGTAANPRSSTQTYSFGS